MDTAQPYSTASADPTLRVLVAEDDAGAAEALATLLRRNGFQPIMARDGLTALELAEEHAPDVALLDLGLPGMDGYQVAERLTAANVARRPLLVAVTGRGAALDRACSAAAGIDLHLVKPIDPEQLLGLLRRFTETVRP
jgi:CheY-like chemotaxis protein